jgi:hypothetical protein
VGDRLGTAGYNVAYGGTSAFTGPTLSGCDVASGSKTLTIAFNASLLKGDKVTVRPFPPQMNFPVKAGGSQLYVHVNASNFCMEPVGCTNKTDNKPIPGVQYCPTWAGGDGVTHYPTHVNNNNIGGAVQEEQVGAAKPTPPPPPPPPVTLDSQWIMLNYTLGADGNSLEVDLSPLNGSVPTAVRYAWGIFDCCDYSDDNLYITHGCIANCPIMSSSALPANPFMAKITGGKCQCVAPQVC